MFGLFGRIPTFAEFCGDTTPKVKTKKQKNNQCPACGANLKDDTCEYCGNFYGKHTKVKSSYRDTNDPGPG